MKQALLLSLLLLAGPAFALNPNLPRKPLIHGICQKPFPALMHLDYQVCRASAWLAALGDAARYLPESLNNRLKQQRLQSGLSRLAICGLICPIDVVTPENAQGNSIRVFLKWPADPVKETELIIADPWRIALEAAIIWETRDILQRLRDTWPKSVNESRAKMAHLEYLTNLLEDLWLAMGLNQEAAHQKWFTAFDSNNTAASIALAAAQQMPEASMEGLEKAIKQFLEREISDRANSQLWNYLLVHALYLRAIGYQKRDLPALAETDFNTALARLKKPGAPREIEGRIYNSRGQLHKQRHNIIAMCQDYTSACAHGDCLPLSLARRDGLCLQ